VIDEEPVDVRGRHLGHPIDGLETGLVVERALLSDAKPRVGPNELLASRRKPLRAADVDGWFLEVARMLPGGDDYTSRPVVDQAVVEQAQRLTYERRLLVIVHGDRRAHDRRRVQGGMLAKGHGDGG